ncbi:MAG: P-II family nitrogen regulator [Deltaproteobacteria bacterium]|jgi:nitrogen regulatory protein PII|nr:P-II family nitrogen regulator [Deltaproteobacteria bacterium]
MPALDYSPAKLLIGVVRRRNGDYFMKVVKKAGARGGTISMARSVSGGRILQLLALGDVLQEVIFSVLGPEADKVVSTLREEARANPRKLKGTAVVLEAPAMSLKSAGLTGSPTTENQISPSERKAQSIRKEEMPINHKLITVIVNSGYANEIMAVARKAGARGGTILTARGTGTEEDVKFFGITLVPEKEILMIISELNTYESILAAISKVPILSEPGGGIVYTQNVEEFIILGKS